MIAVSKTQRQQQPASASAAIRKAANRFCVSFGAAVRKSVVFTRDSQSSRNARKLLKTIDRASLYPERPGAASRASISMLRYLEFFAALRSAGRLWSFSQLKQCWSAQANRQVTPVLLVILCRESDIGSAAFQARCL